MAPVAAPVASTTRSYRPHSSSCTDVTRQINGKVMTGRVPITDPILPGDTIYLRERLF